jgi:hypothetical protein
MPACETFEIEVAAKMLRRTDVTKTITSTGGAPSAHVLSPEARIAAGKALRDKIPREQHGRWNGVKGRPNPIDLLHKSDAGRMKKLLAIR